MNLKQKAIIIGSILGDGYVQKTGKVNARLRLEHSFKQREYLLWKKDQLQNFFQSKPQVLVRNNAQFGKHYHYVRLQSYSGSEFGTLQRLFYRDNCKIVPKEIVRLLKSPLSLAVWFMDDGYYYPRDRIAYIYIPNYDQTSIDNLLAALEHNFLLRPRVKRKKRGEFVLMFPVDQTVALMKIIGSYVHESMRYKIPSDPVSTDPSKSSSP